MSRDLHSSNYIDRAEADLSSGRGMEESIAPGVKRAHGMIWYMASTIRPTTKCDLAFLVQVVRDAWQVG